MRRVFVLSVAVTLIFAGSFFQPVYAQTTTLQLDEIILRYDSLFWKAYNSCDTTQFKSFFTSDVEFYHDKGGITHGLDKLIAVTKNNLCGANDFRLRREAVPGTVKVFPLQNGDVIYGAIISGEHVFYIRQGGKERLDGLAKFTHLWLLKDGAWKMTRILSYDHGPAQQQGNNKEQISLSKAILDQYIGKYKGPENRDMSVASGEGFLKLSVEQKVIELYPESDNRFFVKGRDLVFEFIKHNGSISKMIVRENGQVVEEAIFLSR